uniref:Charged multivesicular body protein 4b-like n=1 Tax=Callorhinchus milii TaxID=7868 RepID=A0A4W3GVE2_CALMI
MGSRGCGQTRKKVFKSHFEEEIEQILGPKNFFNPEKQPELSPPPTPAHPQGTAHTMNLGKLFNFKGKGTKAPTPQDAIQKLAETEGILVKKQEFLEQKVQQEIATARKHGTKNKRAALQALKRKKRYEQQLSQIDGTLSTLEFQREALENATTNTEVLKTMSEAAKAMKSAHQNMDIDKVDELMSDITEQQDLAQEISDAISRPVGFGDDVDEDDLMAELEEMEQEDLERDLLNVGEENVEDLSPEALPTVPGLCACV